MHIISSILGETTVIEVDASNGTVSTKTSKAKYTHKDSGINLRETCPGKENHAKNPKKKGGVAMLLVTGSDVASKEYVASGDDTVKKIIENGNLLWTIHEGNGTPTIDFIRKSSLGNLWEEMESQSLYVAGTIVSRQAGTDIEAALRQLYEKTLSLNLIKQSEEFRALFFDTLFEKSKLPVLLFFFLLLFVNYVAFSNIKEKNDIAQTAYDTRLRKTKANTENREKANRLFGEYGKIPAYPLALMSDRIASYVPKDVRLVSMDFFPENNPNAGGKAKEADKEVIIVKGKAGIAGTVLLFAQYLQEDKLFRKVDIANINNLKEAGTYEFEIRITP